MTNQFKLRLSQDLSVYQYDVQVTPDHMSDSYIMQGLFKQLKRKLDVILGLYVQSGRAVFTTTDLQESVTFEVNFRGIDYQVHIDVETKHYFSGKTVGKMEDHSVMHTLLNIIVKQAFRETNLR
jgi:Leu/Phe-tRNA-protein transferase